jgi:hypothetical protein
LFHDDYDSDVLDLPIEPRNRSASQAKAIASSARKIRSGLRALASRSMPAADAAARIDDHLVRLLKSIALCEVHASLVDASTGNPNDESRYLASKVAQDLYMAYRMVPLRVTASVEGGIMLTYRDHASLEMEIEVDNDGDVTGVVSTDHDVLLSSAITLPAEFSRLVSFFRLSASSRLHGTR